MIGSPPPRGPGHQDETEPRGAAAGRRWRPGGARGGMRGRVLVTGASGALGGSVVRRFLAGGERVLAVYGSHAGDLAGLAPADRLAVRQVDLGSTAEVERLFGEELAAETAPVVAHLVG